MPHCVYCWKRSLGADFGVVELYEYRVIFGALLPIKILELKIYC
jgi:hypothetical protein